MCPGFAIQEGGLSRQPLQHVEVRRSRAKDFWKGSEKETHEGQPWRRRKVKRTWSPGIQKKVFRDGEECSTPFNVSSKIKEDPDLTMRFGNMEVSGDP